jgi:ribosome-associated protein
MHLNDIQKENLQKEVTISAVRSSGPGGQNVNKVSTKIELRWNIAQSQVFTLEQTAVLLEKLGETLTRESELIIVSQEHRSQLKNKEEAFNKFFKLLAKTLTPRKKRKPTQPTLASKQKRVESKKITGEKKALRSKIKPIE